jgi:hypothetical protein
MIAFILMLLFLVWLYLWLYRPPTLKIRIDEGFQTNDLVAEEKKLMEDLVKDINKSKKEWVAYLARYKVDKDSPYVLLKENEPVMEGKVLSDNGKKRVEITDVKEKKRVMVLTEVAPHEYRGALEGNPIYIRYRNRKERIILKTDKVEVIGKGSLGHSKSLTKPWFETAPLVFRENGKTPTGAMVYPWKNKKIKDNMKAIPVELSSPKDKPVAPLFAVYILLQEILSKKI